MLLNISLTRRLSGIVRFGALCILALFFVSAGCSNPGFRHDNLAPAPTLEMGQQVPQESNDTEPFALTNEGRRIEDRLLSRQRPVRLPD